MKCNKCGYDDNGTGDTAHACTFYQSLVKPVKPPQRTWVGLTDEEIEYYILHRLGGVATKKNLVNLIRLCESKLKELNT